MRKLGPVIYRLKNKIPAGSLCHADRVVAGFTQDSSAGSMRKGIAEAIFSAYCSGYETGRSYQRRVEKRKAIRRPNGKPID